MTIKSLLLIGTLALAGIASARSYDLVLSAPAKAGSVQLAAGEYTVTSQGSIAVFTNVETGKKFITAVKAATAAQKFENTAAQLTSVDGNTAITAVELGDTDTVLDMQ